MPHSMGYRRDLPDFRDHRLHVAAPVLAALPLVVDLRPQCSPVLDQGQLGSCVSNAVAGALEFDQMKQGIPPYTPSRLFVYYNGRVLEHAVPYDAGLTIRDGIKSVAKKGYCSETAYPYDVSQFATRPPDACFASALPMKSISYSRVTQDLQQLQGTLAAGFPIVFGFSVYTSFESDIVAKTGIVPMPLTSETLLGGHAVNLVGYRESDQVWICKNSWNTTWGDQGYFYLSYPYLLDQNLSADFWVVTHVLG